MRRVSPNGRGLIINISRKFGRTAVAVTGAATLVALAAGAAGAASSQPRAGAGAQLKLVAGSTEVVLDRYPDGGVLLDLGTHLVAGKNPIEVRATRKSYGDPIVGSQIVNGKAKALPAGMVTDFAGLAKLTHLTITDAKGKKVYDKDRTFCLNGEGSRTRPDAPATSPYPDGCRPNPFTLGAVWGLQAGWSANTETYDEGPLDLPIGKYTAKLTVNKAYRDLFKIGAYDSAVTLKVTVRNAPDCGHTDGCRQAFAKAKAKLAAKVEGGPAAAKAAPKPHAQRPTGKASVPKGPKPDLRSLPAWQVVVAEGKAGTPSAGRDFLQFSANVWNAGPSTLVLDGFRQKGKDLMDAYQYFYDEKGKEVGYAKTGTMEWDARDGHTHWHFTDFARYSLLNAKQTEVVRSQKEAFCLAATDSIDYTVKNANWHPMNTDLHTACGNHGSLSVREVLDVGSGDTYEQSLPGQSFDITGLPNGTYFIEVNANPEKRLFESNLNNNKSLRKVILGGTPHHRTVKVPPVQLVDAP